MQFIVTVPDICKQSGCLIQVTLQWLKNSTVPTDLTLYTEKSQTFNIDKNIFLSFVFHNDWLQIIVGSQSNE